MRKFFIIAALLAALGGFAALWYFYGSSANSGTAEAPSFAEVKLGNLESLVTAQGTLEAKDYVDVGAQVSGTVIKMHVEIGDTVKEGDPIAEIDPDVYEAKVRADKARINQLQAQKAEQEALIKQAQWKFERNQNLFNDKAVSKEVLEDAEITLDVAKAGLLSIEAQLEEAQSDLEGDETNLGYTKIYAPMAGTVVDQAVQEGQTINANQTTPTIVQVANLDVMTAKAEVAEADVMKLQEGMPVYFTTLGSGARRWEGTVRQILPTPEEVNDVVLYNVLVDVKNDDRSLLPGMTTQMFFVLAKAESVPLIPATALAKPLPESDTDQGKAYEIEVMGARGPETRTVIIGLSDRSHAAVVQGLSAGENIVIRAKAGTGTTATTSGRFSRMRL
ncbi:MAG: efflux RND transporter periplasmic adaptor subunit [Alphaproteobacteria bacterium]|nr:efflux RND transporter periplasmic adaptor subunit [Alphaproteobacteria bacterium]